MVYHNWTIWSVNAKAMHQEKASAPQLSHRLIAGEQTAFQQFVNVSENFWLRGRLMKRAITKGFYPIYHRTVLAAPY